ncbi:hypothetical protein FVE85_6894 [Porphyridium purpureum]|uniref:Uncharacterized protein n=1 Tax=Porphyridium purpureum TaxID=35688 RepID=A0A5J4Z5H8_PORPP|nr:hypothetical protein FVE85_6894 [Porphyridium purpureum]|eukprot:POR5931..scf295_1
MDAAALSVSWVGPSTPLMDGASFKGGGDRSESVRRFGDCANVFWRAIPPDHLRAHPDYVPLPLTRHVRAESAADFWRFRQSSVQWDLLHRGRITGSKVPALLGLYEPHAHRTLRTPVSLVSHSKVVRAYKELLDQPLRQDALLRDLNAEYEANRLATFDHKSMDPGPDTVWRQHEPKTMTDAGRFQHRMQYCPPADLVMNAAAGAVSPLEARLKWGMAQECTAVLAALNYFCALPGASVHEVGMFALEALYPDAASLLQAYPDCKVTQDTMPLLGASPDGLIQMADGTQAVLEVKNSAPFVWSKRSDKHRTGRLAVAMKEPHSCIGHWISAQLQLEMLCVGPHCRLAFLVACTGTSGCNVLRVARDDAFISRMLLFCSHFTQQYVYPKRQPPRDFYPDALSGSLRREYAALERDLKRIQSSAVVEVHVPDVHIQRSPHNGDYFLN